LVIVRWLSGLTEKWIPSMKGMVTGKRKQARQSTKTCRYQVTPDMIFTKTFKGYQLFALLTFESDPRTNSGKNCVLQMPESFISFLADDISPIPVAILIHSFDMAADGL